MQSAAVGDPVARILHRSRRLADIPDTHHMGRREVEVDTKMVDAVRHTGLHNGPEDVQNHEEVLREEEVHQEAARREKDNSDSEVRGQAGEDHSRLPLWAT